MLFLKVQKLSYFIFCVPAQLCDLPDLLTNHNQRLLWTDSWPGTSSDVSVGQIFANVSLFFSHVPHLSQYLISSNNLNKCNFTRIEHLTASPCKEKCLKNMCLRWIKQSMYQDQRQKLSDSKKLHHRYICLGADSSAAKCPSGETS